MSSSEPIPVPHPELAFDIRDKFLGPMPVDLFLQEFVPAASAARPQATFSFSRTTVSQNEDEFIEAIRTSGLCPDLHIVNTTSVPRKKRRVKHPDMLVFSRHPNQGSESQQPAEHDWGNVELWIKTKRNRDPFLTIRKLQRFHSNADYYDRRTKGYKTCNLLITYATALHRSQFRIFSFSVVTFGDNARLLRWDRSGVIYTEAFKLADRHLSEFLWRFNYLSAVNRGYDTTISLVDNDEAKAALPKLRTYPTFENVRKEHLHQILVWDDHSPDDRPKRYIAPRAKWVTDALIGRATFGYIAFDVERGELVYLKDFWRVDHPERQKEGDVYRELYEAEVPNIAKMGPAGDVHHVQVSSTGFQSTRTQDYVRAPGRLHAWCYGFPTVVPYVHYRLVLETVGMPLSHFKSTRQLCEVIRDAVIAHKEAYNKTRILHRDISAKNILISDNGTGILIDWDLSKKVEDNPDVGPRQYSRTGTWEFLSIGRLKKPRVRPHALSDDLESFFWVLLYEIIRYRDCESLYSEQSIQQVFGRPTGYFDSLGTGKLNCIFSLRLSSLTVEILVKTPCRNIIEEMRSLFRGLYTDFDIDFLEQSSDEEGTGRGPPAIVSKARKKLRTSDVFLAILENHLRSEWDIDDDGSLDRPELQPDESTSRRRLKRKTDDRSDSSEENIHVRRIGRYPPSTEESASNEGSSRTCCSSDSGWGHAGNSSVTSVGSWFEE